MSTETQSAKVHHLDDEHIEGTFLEAREHLKSIEEALKALEYAICEVRYQDASEAFTRAFTTADKLTNNLLADTIAFMVDAVGENDDSYEDPDEQHKAAWETIAQMSAYAELIAFSAYARTTIKTELIATPEAIEEVRFSQRLSRELYEASTEIECKEWDAAWERLQGSMADISVLRSYVDSKDDTYPESHLASFMFNEIDRVEQYVHTNRRAQS